MMTKAKKVQLHKDPSRILILNISNINIEALIKLHLHGRQIKFVQNGVENSHEINYHFKLYSEVG